MRERGFRNGVAFRLYYHALPVANWQHVVARPESIRDVILFPQLQPE